MTGAPALDPRINAYRPDLADRRLEGRVTAAAFVDGEPRRVAVPVAPLHRSPAGSAPTDTEALYGEAVLSFQTNAEGWSWCQLAGDGYVGWLPPRSLGAAEPGPTHRVTALRTFIYPEADLKKPPRAALSMGSLVRLSEDEALGAYRLLADGAGAVSARHVAPLAEGATDFVAVAETFLHTPYLWGGRSGFGLDCSGLVQLSLAMAGVAAPRDSDMQEAALGLPGLDVDSGALRRGDLVFWRGHVGIMADGAWLLHANAHHMAVAVEPLAEAIARIASRGSLPTAVRRL